MKKDFRLVIENLENRKVLSNDQFLNYQWGLEVTKTKEAWGLASLNNTPIVAIIDSGIDLNHNDLKSNLWINSKEIANDNIDNDSNGYVDDIYGWNFSNNTNNVQDGFYHGTHVAGIIGAVNNNNLGIAGVAPNVKLMILKFQNDSGFGYAGAAASSINYVIAMKNKGENIVAINASWTAGGADNNVLRTYIQKANDAGIIFVNAAGNEGLNNDVNAQYPTSYNYSNQISVAAIDPDLSLAGYSNYGKKSINLAAPGSNVYSTLPGNSYGYISGSSMAAPFVSGATAILKSINIYYSASQIKKAILDGASYVSGLAERVRHGLLDIVNSVNILKTMVPELKPVPVEQPKPVIKPVTPDFSFVITNITRRNISGFTSYLSNPKNKLIVEISINNKVRYFVKADDYRKDSNRYDGFSISLNKYYFTKRWNLVTIRVKDPISNKVTTVVSKMI